MPIRRHLISVTSVGVNRTIYSPVQKPIEPIGVNVRIRMQSVFLCVFCFCKFEELGIRVQCVLWDLPILEPNSFVVGICTKDITSSVLSEFSII